MDTALPAYRLDESFRIIPLDEGPDAAGWNRSLRSEEIGEGWRVNFFDFHAAREEIRTIEGPPTFSISLFLSGAGRLALDNGAVLDVEPGTLFLFHAPHPTRGLNQVNAGCHMLGLDFRFAPALLEEIGLQSLGCLVRAFSGHGSVQDALLMSRPLNAPLRCIAQDVLACRMTGTARRVFLQSKALEVLSYIIAFCETQPAETTALTRRDQARVQDAAELLGLRYSDPWTIAGLARAVGLNERKLKQGFRQLLGRTVHDYLERTRITAAQKLMTDDGLGVTEAALAVGYSNPSHFAKMFKRRLGASPSAWRRAMTMNAS